MKAISLSKLGLLLTSWWVGCGSVAAHADIIGFDSLDPNIWKYNQTDSGNLPQVGQEFVEITNSPDFQRRSIWHRTQQDIRQFETTFRYQATGTTFGGSNSGIAILFHLDPRGLDAVPTGGFGAQGIDNSVAVAINLSRGNSGIGIYRNGIVGGGSISIAPLDIYHGIDVTLVYNGSLMNLSIRDGINAPFSTNLIVSPSIQQELNSMRGIVGFGAISSADSITQRISNFRFFETAAVPEPGTGFFIAMLSLIGATRRLKQSRPPFPSKGNSR